MKYTVRFAHLMYKPDFEVGHILKRGDIIGTMGTTGQSTAKHLHIDCIAGDVRYPFKLGDIGKKYRPDKEQLDFFIDDELFGIKPFITTDYLDKAYKQVFGKDHPAYDVVPSDRFESTKHHEIHWNRSYLGEVVLVLYQPESYGNCVYVMFDTERKV